MKKKTKFHRGKVFLSLKNYVFQTILYRLVFQVRIDDVLPIAMPPWQGVPTEKRKGERVRERLKAAISFESYNVVVMGRNILQNSLHPPADVSSVSFSTLLDQFCLYRLGT